MSKEKEGRYFKGEKKPPNEKEQKADPKPKK